VFRGLLSLDVSADDFVDLEEKKKDTDDVKTKLSKEEKKKQVEKLVEEMFEAADREKNNIVRMLRFFFLLSLV